MQKTVYILILGFLFTSISAQQYKKHILSKDKLAIELSDGVLNIIPLTEKSIRIQYEIGKLKEEQDFVLINKSNIPNFKLKESLENLQLSTKGMSVWFNKKTGVIKYSDASGKVFLTEKANSRILKPTIIMGESCFIAEQGFESPKDEYLFGLGQFQDGFYNLKDVTRKLIQVNTQIAIPFLVSNKGYGLLWHQYGLTYFNPTNQNIDLIRNTINEGEKREVEVTTTSGTQKVSQQQSVYSGTFSIAKEGKYSLMLDLGDMDSRHLVLIDGIDVINQSNLWLPPAVSKLVELKAGEHTVKVVCKSSNTPSLSLKLTNDETVFNSPNAKSLDYIVFAGKNTDEIIANYRNLTGNVPMLPKWAFGFWQCRERYTSGEHLVSTIREFRKRNLPVDVIVQDWQYWGKYGWGVPKFDETHYPEPEKFIKEIHDLNAHFSISVWENLNKESEIGKEYVSKNLFIPNSPWIDIYNPETQKTHWNVLNKNLFTLGVDSWWMDATEPENDALRGKQTYFGLGDFYRLTYPLFVSKAVYEGQKKTNPEKRVTILTRSAFLGQQRYGTINWSGDIGWDWDAYKRQIVAGLNYNVTGMPYWTTDIGGFFRPGSGQYKDEKYHEILIRWFQWAVFNPIFRMHGYQTETEPWKYGEKVENNMRSMLNLRYQLMPYIYSEAWQISKYNSTLMRPLIMDFNYDAAAVSQAYQYMFGKSLLIAPVTAPEVTKWNVYLPKQNGWYDFWTGKRFEGGQTIQFPVTLDKIPVFVKEGSIVPIGNVIQNTKAKQDELEIRIYAGKDASFTFYNDEGDNYNYEKGKYIEIPITWNEKNQSLTIGKQIGSYNGETKTYTMNIVWISAKQKSDIPKKVKYTGKEILIKM
ncbi:glycoside hydrolase family 31 protein [Flavobacterium hibisci]|uniref:glycoside hydrolase family 31 protein n=1 Tax=Flavobacterium hibisci TaxID=1914462 RepID=UPI001CBF6EC0|nr:TIM-barrel domain-containing protein [Flavobacterium hibisci]MBZ4042220.1 glycoside hydrolase family 31 protein [Flavobacterium hibisci]